jgi:long-chain acyl-CoA synthetase
MTIAEANARLTAPGAPFETEALVIRGVPTRVYKQAMRDLRQIFDQSLDFASRDLIVYEDERLTYGDHYRAAAALGRELAEAYGVRKGDRVAIAMRNLPEWSIAFWATVAIGAVATPLNAWGLGPDLAYGITNAAAKVAIVDGERLERLRPHLDELGLKGLISVRTPAGQSAPARPLEEIIGPPADYAGLPDTPPPDRGIHPDDDATILYTSGTTGKSKGALGTHRNAVTNMISITFSAARGRLRKGLELLTPDPNAPQPVNLLPVPFFHVTGCHSMLIPTVARGAKVVLMHRWNPERFMELIEREKVNRTTNVPAMVWQVLESPEFASRDLSSLQSYGYGGAAIAPELTFRFAEAFPQLEPSQGYGATETSSVAVSNIGEDYLERPDSIGLPAPVVDLKVMTAEGREAAVNEAGELWIRGPNVVKGYWNDPAGTTAAFTDGWYHTGDICRIDAEGFVYLLDRAKDMLIRGGENIYCVEIEDVLVSHPEIMDAAVVGLPHRIWGEEVGAVVQVRPGGTVDAAELAAFVAGRLAAFKVPVRIDVRTEEFPRNASGKTLKPVLREQMLAQVAAEAQPDHAPA